MGSPCLTHDCCIVHYMEQSEPWKRGIGKSSAHLSPVGPLWTLKIGVHRLEAVGTLAELLPELGEAERMSPPAASRLEATSCEISRAGCWRAWEYCAFVNIWTHLLSSLPKKPLGKPTSQSAMQCSCPALIVKSVECFSHAHKNETSVSSFMINSAAALPCVTLHFLK